MRMRVVRFGIAAAVGLTALGAGIGLTGSQSLARSVLRDVSRVAVAPAHALSAAGLSGPMAGHEHERVTGTDAAVASALLVSLAVALGFVISAASGSVRRAGRAHCCRAPPRAVVVTSSS